MIRIRRDFGADLGENIVHSGKISQLGCVAAMIAELLGLARANLAHPRPRIAGIEVIGRGQAPPLPVRPAATITKTNCRGGARLRPYRRAATPWMVKGNDDPRTRIAVTIEAGVR